MTDTDTLKARIKAGGCSTGYEGNETCEDYYPHYGVGPHICFYKIEGAVIGQSQSTLNEHWPVNFFLEVEDGESLRDAMENSPCGIWTCPNCTKEDMKVTDGLISRSEAMRSLSALQKGG